MNDLNNSLLAFFSLDMNGLTLVIITALVIVVIISQASRLKHKKNRNYLQITQKELEQRIADRTEKLHTLNDQLYREIAEHQATETLLSETQNYLTSIINSMPSILIGVTAEGFITHWNLAAENATNISANTALGKSLLEVYPSIPVTLMSIRETINNGTPRLTENIQQSHGNSRQHIDLTIYPLVTDNNSSLATQGSINELAGAVIRLDNVTLRVQMENTMIQNEKMMSLGELAAGMAHEINNPLSAMVNAVQNIQRRTSVDFPANLEAANKHQIKIEQVYNYLNERSIFKFLDSIREAGDRAARIVTNMLEFSRSSSRSHELIDIIKLTEHSLELANHSFELKTPDGIEKVTINKEFEANIPLLQCSAPELQQVVLNLLRNACQAFTSSSKEDTKPTITLRLYQWENNICLEVEDNGQGMPEDVRCHIFEPFYTTKELGQGTGLGLSVTYFIVTEHHNGSIEVESAIGRGTNFIITLPMHSP